MRTFLLALSVDAASELVVQAHDKNDAVSIAVTALHQFFAATFPPPPIIEITIMDTSRNLVATMRLRFDLDMGEDTKAIQLLKRERDRQK